MYFANTTHKIIFLYLSHHHRHQQPYLLEWRQESPLHQPLMGFHQAPLSKASVLSELRFQLSTDSPFSRQCSYFE